MDIHNPPIEIIMPTTASPHQFDHSVQTYDFNYHLDGKMFAGIYLLGFCAWCGKKYSILAQVNSWILYHREAGGDITNPIAQIAGTRPCCVKGDCKGYGEDLTVTSHAAIVTSEGEWLNLEKMGGGLA